MPSTPRKFYPDLLLTPFSPGSLPRLPRQNSLPSSEHGENLVFCHVLVCSLSSPRLPPTCQSQPGAHDELSCTIPLGTQQGPLVDVMVILHVKMHLKQENDIECKGIISIIIFFFSLQNRLVKITVCQQVEDSPVGSRSHNELQLGTFCPISVSAVIHKRAGFCEWSTNSIACGAT